MTFAYFLHYTSNGEIAFIIHYALFVLVAYFVFIISLILVYGENNAAMI